MIKKINNLKELSAMLKRFLLGEPDYIYEFDEFLLVDNKNKILEKYRLMIEEDAKLLLSKNKDDRYLFMKKIKLIIDLIEEDIK